MRDPDDETVLIEGVLFRAKYLGSTQLISEGQPSKAMRMMQAQEAVGRIKVCIDISILMECLVIDIQPKAHRNSSLKGHKILSFSGTFFQKLPKVGHFFF